MPSGGGKSFAKNYIAAPGGPAAVASIAVSALGHEAVFLGRLGDDEVGRTIISKLTDCGVDVSGVRYIDKTPSQVSSVVVDQDGERQIINFSSTHLDSDPSWLPHDIIAAADFLLTDVRWPQGTEEALKLARRYKVPSLIDADIAPTDTSRLVCLADHAVFSERGLQAFVDEPTIEKRLQTAHQKSGGWVAVTAGDKGSYWLDDQSGLVSCPADQVNAVDTCGAGDVFHGAFSVAMVERMKMEKAMSFASAAATLKCLKFGGSLGVPDRLAVDRFIEEQ